MANNGLTPLFTTSQIKRWCNRFQYRAEEKMITLLQAAGEKFVTYARESGKYKDHTGNLRSSIGYVIASNGEIIQDDFANSDEGTDKATGKAKAKRLAANVAMAYMEGLVLIGVAGMEYAVYVESIEGKDVIASANIQTEEWLRTAIRTTFERM